MTTLSLKHQAVLGDRLRREIARYHTENGVESTYRANAVCQCGGNCQGSTSDRAALVNQVRANWPNMSEAALHTCSVAQLRELASVRLHGNVTGIRTNLANDRGVQAMAPPSSFRPNKRITSPEDFKRGGKFADNKRHTRDNAEEGEEKARLLLNQQVDAHMAPPSSFRPNPRLMKGGNR